MAHEELFPRPQNATHLITLSTANVPCISWIVARICDVQDVGGCLSASVRVPFFAAS
jgi:hypothetical protein